MGCGPWRRAGKRRETFTARESEALRRGRAGSPRPPHSKPGELPGRDLADGRRRRGHQQALAPLVAPRGAGLSVVAGCRNGRPPASAATAQARASWRWLRLRHPVPGRGPRFSQAGLRPGPPSDFLGDLDAVCPDEDGPEGWRRRRHRPDGAPWLDSNGCTSAWPAASVSQDAVARVAAVDLGQALPATAYLRPLRHRGLRGAVDGVARPAPSGRPRGGRAPPSRPGHDRPQPRLLPAARGVGGLRPAGQLGVVSDYNGTNEFVSFEVLNLLAARQPLPRPREGLGPAAPLDGLDASSTWTRRLPHGPRPKLYAFAEGGGRSFTRGWEERGTHDATRGLPDTACFGTAVGGSRWPARRPRTPRSSPRTPSC